VADVSAQYKAPHSLQAKNFDEEIMSFFNSRARSEQVIVGGNLIKEAIPKLKKSFLVARMGFVFTILSLPVITFWPYCSS